MGGRVDELERAVAACAARIGPARTHYTTADSVEDVEAVRSALGIDKLVLYGTSYGTKVALDYAAAHPEHVSRLLLDSTILPEGVDSFERATIASIPRVMRAICATAAAASPRPRRRRPRSRSGSPLVPCRVGSSTGAGMRTARRSARSTCCGCCS